MRGSRQSRRPRHVAASALAVATLALTACGDEEETTSAAAGSTATGSPTTATIEDEGPRIAQAPDGSREAGDADEPATPSQAPVAEDDGSAGGDESSEVSEQDRLDVAAAEQTYRAYVEAINARDGAALCRLLDPSFRDELELPVRRGSCAQQLSRSIGYRDPRGTPVWKRTFLQGTESALLRRGENVQLSTAIVTRFAGGSQPSVESDIAYLSPAPGGESWILAKAPGSLWRAVGKPDVPPSVITPPEGF